MSRLHQNYYQSLGLQCPRPPDTPSKLIRQNVAPCSENDAEGVREPIRGGLLGLGSYLLPSDSDESLKVVTRDSIEDLSSVVPRSPKSVKEKEAEKVTHHVPPSPGLSPRRSLKKKLTVTISGTEFDIDKKRRPMSPFTSGGMLRKFVPPSAPAAVTEFGPSIKDEIDPGLREVKHIDQSSERCAKRTTRAERGGTRLMGFLGRRFGSN